MRVKRILALVLAAALLASACIGLSGCSEDAHDGAAETGYSFVQDIVARDYKSAYEHVYSFSSDVKSESDFVERFENIYDALRVTRVELIDRSVGQISDSEYVLDYRLRITSELLGVNDYTFRAEIMAGPLGYSVLYSPDLILPMLEEGDKVRVQYQEGDRGEIFTQDGKLLAKNDYAESVYIDLDHEPDIEQVKSVLSSLFDADVERIQSRYEAAVESERPVQVLLTFPRGTITQEEYDTIDDVTGLSVDTSSLTEKRYYPFRDNTAHAVGYLGAPTDDEIAEDPSIDENSLVGRTGIEQVYESVLRGSDGWRIYVEDSRGEIKEVLYDDPKTDGSDVYLTLDSTMQNRAYTLLQANCTDDQSGVVIVLDYNTGDVRAMANYPSYDPNLFNPVSDEVWKHYSEDPLTPMFSRCTQADYMPGSTFKVFSAVPAIENGVLDENSIPPITIGKGPTGGDTWIPTKELTGSAWTYPAITRVSTPSGRDYENAIKSSDNIFFAYYALKTGVDGMRTYLERIGIGEAPAFELPVRASSYGNEDTDYNLHWAAQAGYGIGISITPIQVASMYTAVMNDGDMLNPTIVDKVSRTEGAEEEVEWENEKTFFKRGTMNSKAIRMAKQAMRRVMLDGTAYKAGLGVIEGLMGKTGTAQYDGKDREMNWIVAINPNDENIYLVMVDAKRNEGTEPKLAILRGMLLPKTYTTTYSGDYSDDSTYSGGGGGRYTYNDSWGTGGGGYSVGGGDSTGGGGTAQEPEPVVPEEPAGGGGDGDAAGGGGDGDNGGGGDAGGGGDGDAGGGGDEGGGGEE